MSRGVKYYAAMMGIDDRNELAGGGAERGEPRLGSGPPRQFGGACGEMAAPAVFPGTVASDGASPMALSALVSPRVGSVMGR
jgi:hypothetical protein